MLWITSINIRNGIFFKAMKQNKKKNMPYKMVKSFMKWIAYRNEMVMWWKHKPNTINQVTNHFCNLWNESDRK